MYVHMCVYDDERGGLMGCSTMMTICLIESCGSTKSVAFWTAARPRCKAARPPLIWLDRVEREAACHYFFDKYCG